MGLLKIDPYNYKASELPQCGLCAVPSSAVSVFMVDDLTAQVQALSRKLESFQPPTPSAPQPTGGG